MANNQPALTDNCVTFMFADNNNEFPVAAANGSKLVEILTNTGVFANIAPFATQRKDFYRLSLPGAAVIVTYKGAEFVILDELGCLSIYNTALRNLNIRTLRDGSKRGVRVTIDYDTDTATYDCIINELVATLDSIIASSKAA